MKLSIIVSFFLLSFSSTFSQVNFLPGSVKKNNGEQVHGLIDYREWSMNPEAIRFKEKADGPVTTYTIDDISTFTITGKDVYIRQVVSRDMRPVEINDLTVDAMDSVETGAVFLRVLLEGKKLSLYGYTDAKPHFYIKDSTGKYQELLFKVYLREREGAQFVEKRPIFLDQLKSYATNDAALLQILKKSRRARYDENNIRSLVSMINGETIAARDSQKRSKPVFFASGGPAISSMKIKGQDKLESLNYSGSVTPAFGLGVDIFSERSFRALGLRFEVLYTSSKFEGKGKFTDRLGDDAERTYSFRMTNISPTATFLFSPFRGPDYRVYAGIGLAYNFSSYPEDVMTETSKQTGAVNKREDYIGYEKSWMSGTATAGAVFAKKYEVILNAKLLGAFEKYVGYSIDVNTYTIRVAYRFQ